MPPPFQRQFNVGGTGDITLPLATETVVLTLNGVSPGDASLNIHLRAVAHVSTGVGATTLTPRIRRTSLTGGLVGEADAVSSPASSIVISTVEADDAPGDVASLVYVFTLTAAGVAGTSLNASLIALVG